MKRLIDAYLKRWKNESHRKPLLLRGARQVGKTYAVRVLGASFENFVEVNLELHRNIHTVFQKDLVPDRIIVELSLLLGKPIIPGKTLLFFDEIQCEPQAVLALRYFYELMPKLHVIAAGSLLDFVIEKVGIPVGRVESLYMYPLSFMEYLAARQEKLLLHELLTSSLEKKMEPSIHDKLLSLVGEYIAVGGMPESVSLRLTEKDPLRWTRAGTTILDAYRQDFEKYARESQLKYIKSVFNSIPRQLGNKFKFSLIEGEYRKRELSPALHLLETAGVAHQVNYSAGQGIPLGPQEDSGHFKVIFLDVALSQYVLGLSMAEWFVHPLKEFVNKGPLVEALVGQEILAYSSPFQKSTLYFWERQERSSQAEVDYLVGIRDQVLPIEVKSGSGATLRSLHLFLQSHPNCPYGIRFSTQNYSFYEKIYSYPLYTIAKVMTDEQEDMKKSLMTLLE